VFLPVPTLSNQRLADATSFLSARRHGPAYVTFHDRVRSEGVLRPCKRSGRQPRDSGRVFSELGTGGRLRDALRDARRSPTPASAAALPGFKEPFTLGYARFAIRIAEFTVGLIGLSREGEREQMKFAVGNVPIAAVTAPTP
jgi:hypothetical protein